MLSQIDDFVNWVRRRNPQGRTLKANRGVLATNGRLHDRVVEKLADLAA